MFVILMFTPTFQNFLAWEKKVGFRYIDCSHTAEIIRNSNNSIDQLTVDFLACYSFSDTCKLDVDGRPTCTACRAGYTGRNCERCAVGYIGQPSVIGNYCRKVGCKLWIFACRISSVQKIWPRFLVLNCFLNIFST